MSKPTAPQALAPRRVASLLGAVTVALAVLAGTLLAVRTLSAVDLGYHIAYGQAFLETGRIVDTNNRWLYTLDANAPPAGRAETGPGCWYDRQGRYRFPNANWGTQVLLASVHRVAGTGGLWATRWVLVTALLVLSTIWMHRLGLPPAVSAPGLLLLAIVASGRFQLRPELLGFVVLAAQLCVLAGPLDPARRWRWRHVAGLGGLQVVLVNLHSYFLLPLVVTAAILADRAARWAFSAAADRPASDRDALRRGTSRSAVALLVQSAACFLNPWTWRLAVLPIRTLWYIRAHGIAGADPHSPQGHPWARIGEFFAPLSAWSPFESAASAGLLGMLVLAGVGLIGALACRRWSWALLIAAFSFVGMSMRRNLAPSAVVAIPVSLASIAALLRRLGALGRAGDPRSTRAVPFPLPSLAASLGAIVASLALGLSVVTQQWYVAQRLGGRFGWGLSRVALPLDAADWLNARRPAGRVWCDFATSSTLLWRVEPRPELPIVTNTWAYPPALMRRQLDLEFSQAPADAFGAMAREHDVGIVVLRCDAPRERLARRLDADDAWQVVHLDARHVIFAHRVRARPAGMPFETLTPAGLDVAAYIDRLDGADPVGHMTIYRGGLTLLHLGWFVQSAEVIGASLERCAIYAPAWLMRGKALGLAGTKRLLRGDRSGEETLRQARTCFGKALTLREDYPEARRSLAYVDRQLSALKRGQILYPKDELSP